MISFATLLIYIEPDFVITVSKMLDSAPNGAEYIAIIPVGLFIWCIRQSRVILFPSEDAKGILQEWPTFHVLKTRALLGIFYQVVFCISSVSIWIISPNFNNPTAVVVLAMAIIGSLIGAGTFYFASMMVSEITKRYATKSSKLNG